MGGNNLTRSGTGQISVYRYVEGCGYNASGSKYNGLGKQFDSAHKVCTCSKCRQSDTPSKEWWEIIVYTAAHVVFDATEGDHTSCRLFYDDASSPKVILDQLHVINVNVERDSCHMKHVTCDVTLGGKLYAMDKICSDLWNKVRDKYVIRYGERLTFIVSHPHGCHKQVSVGQWMDNAIVGELNEIDTLTCVTRVDIDVRFSYQYCPLFLSTVHTLTCVTRVNIDVRCSYQYCPLFLSTVDTLTCVTRVDIDVQCSYQYYPMFLSTVDTLTCVTRVDIDVRCSYQYCPLFLSTVDTLTCVTRVDIDVRCSYQYCPLFLSTVDTLTCVTRVDIDVRCSYQYCPLFLSTTDTLTCVTRVI
nr:hypothetical protein BgiMline_017948 [Biomphalaria glabrata]